MSRYQCAGKTFDTLGEAMRYASWIFSISGIVLGIEEVKA